MSLMQYEKMFVDLDFLSQDEIKIYNTLISPLPDGQHISY